MIALALADQRLLQPSSASLPVSVALLILAGLLLLAFVLGMLIGRRWLVAPTQIWPLKDVLSALPLPCAFVDPNGVLLTFNAEAAGWLETHSPPCLASPLNMLARRALSSQRPEIVPITLEGQPSQRVQAHPLMGERGDRLRGVLLIAVPGAGNAGPSLTRQVAHELRTPLTAIMGHAEILAGCDAADEAVWRRSRDFIAAETQRLARLVQDLLSLSRLEASPPLAQIVNAQAVVETVLSSLYDQAQGAGLELVLDAPPSLPRIRADSTRLEQALVNLVENAIKYTPAGGTVTVRLSSEGGYVRLDVSDTGPGIAPEDLPHLFEPLYRAESARHLPGTGLGLAIVRAILDQHGAPISVQSKPGQGATFTFRLPVARS